MFNLLYYITNFLGVNDSILIFSFLFLGLSIFFYYYKYYKLSFFLLYIALTYKYFFIILTKNVSSILITYIYYVAIFLCYHIYFTFSKRFYNRTIVVIKEYLNDSEYLKLILWIFLVFIPALFGEAFIFLWSLIPYLHLVWLPQILQYSFFYCFSGFGCLFLYFVMNLIFLIIFF